MPTLLACSSAAVAQTSATLAVKGTITPPSCEISLPDGHVVDFESRPFSDLNVGGTKIDPKTVAMNITCAAPTRVALAITDDKAPTKIAYSDVTSTYWATTLGNDYIFGLGTTGNSADGGAKIGGLMLGLTGGVVTVDTADQTDVQAGVIYSADKSQLSWSSNTTNRQYFSPTQFYSWATSGTAPTPVSKVEGNITITPTIAKSVTLPTTDRIEFDGSVTLNLVYL
ncbi:hypothetical protein WI77_26240 [Burkholderia ubonensis]|uniref:DUF1120 domain-containing protein n=1 Tax=Burkholderia ubonensis TaxID=101571 RepID=UPI00076C1684|nr:DUF1120 domain-containing protein [Burkholderia ubonensis]KVD06618.1 hypothetical protein WI77_26240 [Burkholderia ubonensis]